VNVSEFPPQREPQLLKKRTWKETLKDDQMTPARPHWPVSM